ncbi:MAG: catecholate siderophore receptor Fiu, partial [Pedobacter sp.]|nr:catecholate siderophore receptor Fiu [Pedobacter sp.]
SSRFEYRPLVLALLALHSAPSLAQEAATAPEAAAPVTPEPVAAPVAAPANAAPATELQTVTVKAQAEVPYKADTVSSPKQTQPLLDTPQTITVIKKEILQQQGAVTLMEALRNTPGITVQLGENGNTSQGDSFSMRGFSTQTSTFVDGIRDLGSITRDTYNLDSVEVAKGPAGTDIGRGAAAGYINLVTKLPGLDDAISGTVSTNTAGNTRMSADINEKVNETTALRLNVMGQDGGVPGRNEVELNSWAVAPSIAFGLGTDRRAYIYLQHVQQNNVPDGGIPSIGQEGYYNTVAALSAGAKVNGENFYGSVKDDETVSADMITLRFETDYSPATTLTNTSRYGQTTMNRILTSINTSNTGISVNGQPNNPAAWTVVRARQGVDQENRILGNFTNLATSFDTGGIKHSVATGIELMYEDQTAANFTAPAAASVPLANLYNPNAYDVLPNPVKNGTGSKGQTITTAAYLFDTLELSPAWELTAGARLEHYNTESDSTTLVTATNAATYPGYAVGTSVPSSLSDSDNLLSWKLGALYKPAENGSIYAAYATSQTPPGSANFSLSSGANNANNGKFDPQETTNIEIGTKWDLLESRLALTGAIYQADNENEITYDPISLVYTQEGKTRVKGIELGAVGQITTAWQISAGLAFMDTEVLEGRTTTANNAGSAVRWAPDMSGTLWTTYKLTEAFTVGGGARYMGEQKRVVTGGTNLATQPIPVIPAYWVVDAMASYQLIKNLTVRGNVYNVLDEEYMASVNNAGSRVTLGTPLYASLSLDFQF